MSLRNPVKYPVKYYSWQDAQAPQLSNADGAIKTILKACLVTGYSSKAGAGWTSLFEDDYRIVLRRPLRTGNPPDIKIENGVINGTASHRLITQKDPTGIDDASKLAEGKFVPFTGEKVDQWYCVVTDFAFMFCYQIGGESWTASKGNYLLFVGGAKKIQDTDVEPFFITKFDFVGESNASSPFRFGQTWYGRYQGIYGSDNLINSVASKGYVAKRFALSATADYDVLQPVYTDIAMLPFFASVFNNFADTLTKIASINNRQYLRYVDYSESGNRAIMFIPLDYWEL